MSDIIPARCATVNLSVSLPSFNCTDNIMGDFGNLSDFGRAIGSVPGQLGTMADCVSASVRAQIETAINSLNQTLTSIFAVINTTVPTPLWGNLQAPELEFELRAGALFQEFKLYLQQKLFDIIKNIPGLGFIVNLVNVPIPFLTGVKIFDVFTSEGRARIRAAVAERLGEITSVMGMPWDLTFSGSLGLRLPELQLEYIMRRIFSEIERVLSSALWSALSIIHTLPPTRLISRIWSNLGFPTLPSFQFPSFDEFFGNIWNSIKDLAISMTEKLQRAMTAMLNFDLGAYLSSAFGAILGRIPWPFPTRLADLLGWLNRDWNLSVPEWDFSRLTGAIQTVFNRIPQMILELWMQLVKPFLDAIKGLLAGVAALLAYIPFTFCSFINLVASPLLSLGSTIGDLLPPGIPAMAAPTITPPAIS